MTCPAWSMDWLGSNTLMTLPAVILQEVHLLFTQRGHENDNCIGLKLALHCALLFALRVRKSPLNLEIVLSLIINLIKQKFHMEFLKAIFLSFCFSTSTCSPCSEYVILLHHLLHLCRWHTTLHDNVTTWLPSFTIARNKSVSGWARICLPLNADKNCKFSFCHQTRKIKIQRAPGIWGH